MARAKRLMPYGLICAALAVVFLLFYIPWRSRSEASVRTGRVTAASSTSTLQGMVLDAVDGKTVAKAWVETVDASTGQKTVQPVTAADGLSWTIVSGAAQVGEDSFTGRTLFVPSGTQPVVAQPVLGGLAGPPVTIGLNANIIPTDERDLTAAGGGSCAQNPNHAALFLSMVNVRSVLNATAIPLSQTERVLRYQRAEYYAWAPDAGPMRITLNPDKVSEVHLTSLNPAGSKSFFPASAEAHLYFIIEMLNTGTKIFNPQAMVLRNSSTNWPPFQEPMINDTPVSFVLVDNPSMEMMQIDSQESYIYPTQELAVDLLSQQVTGNVLEASYRIRNLATAGGDVRWFFLGDLGTPQTPTRGLQTIPAGGQALVTLRTQLASSQLTQTITLGAVTQSGARMTGSRKLQVQYPAVAESTPGQLTNGLP